MATYKGIDVSKHQGKIDWQKVKSAGIQFAMLRAGYGRYANQKDEQFEANYTGAKAVGIPVGAYHYSYAKTVEQAKAEAQTFLAWIKGKTFEYPVAFDIEDKSQAGLGKQLISDMIRAFCETVEKAGYYVCVYANKDWLVNRIDEDCKKKYDTWLAEWRSDKPTYSGQYGMWQHTSDGSVSGINGRVDMNYAYKDYPSIMKANSLNGMKKTSSAGGASSNSTTSAGSTANKFAAKTKVTLNKTPLYASATAKSPAAYKTGTFYIYDGKEIFGRYRITSSPDHAGKTPVGENVTGYVNKTDLK